jgi:hypothetical protein
MWLAQEFTFLLRGTVKQRLASGANLAGGAVGGPSAGESAAFSFATLGVVFQQHSPAMSRAN